MRPVLFALDPETAHHLTLQTLKLINQLSLIPACFKKPHDKPCRVMGIDFKNPVGLAAGLDKSGDYTDALSKLGFGFMEIGAVTPKPQEGNPKPRLFRLTKHQSLINRMGFNNRGLDYVCSRIKESRPHCPIGVNIGKNLETSLEDASLDYLQGMRTLYALVDFIVVNISSPNTPGLRHLQETEYLSSLIDALKQEQLHLADATGRRVPLVLKISPDLTEIEIKNIARIGLEKKIDGIVATNTTVWRPESPEGSVMNEKGGLSGELLFVKSLGVVATLASHLKGEIPIIASGGVLSALHAQAMLAAGASLIELFTGLIYRGPKLIHEIIDSLGGTSSRPRA